MKQNGKIILSDFGYEIISIGTIAACNMACSFCPYPLKEDKTSILSIENIKRTLDEVDSQDKNFKYVTFDQFNEPLLDKRIFEIIEYAQDSGFKVLIITNGLLLNKEKNINNLLKLKPQVKISLQVLEGDSLMDARGLNMELQRYLSTILNFCNQVKNTDLDVTIDIGCNFNNKNFKFFLKKLLGFSTGDPSVPDKSDLAIKYMKDFIHKLNVDYSSKGLSKISSDYFDRDYLSQNGVKVFENITIKIKPFHYGRKIKDFEPIDNNFSCNTRILSVQADGNIVPCCLAYDNSISLGKIQNKTLEQALTQTPFLKNLRKKGGEKHITCQKCFGEPTKRGAVVRNFLNSWV